MAIKQRAKRQKGEYFEIDEDRKLSLTKGSSGRWLVTLRTAGMSPKKLQYFPATDIELARAYCKQAVQTAQQALKERQAAKVTLAESAVEAAPMDERGEYRLAKIDFIAEQIAKASLTNRELFVDLIDIMRYQHEDILRLGQMVDRLSRQVATYERDKLKGES